MCVWVTCSLEINVSLLIYICICRRGSLGCESWALFSFLIYIFIYRHYIGCLGVAGWIHWFLVLLIFVYLYTYICKHTWFCCYWNWMFHACTYRLIHLLSMKIIVWVLYGYNQLSLPFQCRILLISLVGSISLLIWELFFHEYEHLLLRMLIRSPISLRILQENSCLSI